MFHSIQFEHNRGFLLLEDLKDPFQPIPKLGIDVLLLQFLQQLPMLFPLQFPLSQATLQTVESVLKYRLCGGNSEFYELLWGCSPTIIQPGSGSHTCGYVFKHGDTIYRCHDCGLDGTCVLCTKCFRSGTHSGHSISMHISQGSGGCCDCGDPEAWKLPMTCKIHCSVSKNDNQPFPQDLVNSIRKTISTVLEMVVDVFDRVPPNPKVSVDVETLKIPNRYDGNNEQQYALILWNDESHSFNEVIEELMDALRCSEELAGEITVQIDKQGREVIHVSESIPVLTAIARKIGRTQLVLSIVQAKEAFRQHLCGFLLEWLKELPENVVGYQTYKNIPMESAQVQVGQIICEELMRPVLYYEMNTDLSSRAKTLLLLGKKIWKYPRICLKQLFIKTMIVRGDEYKKWLANVFARNYLKIAYEYFTDVEEYETKMSALAVQLLTVPSIATNLVRNSDIIQDILALLKAYYMQDNYSGQVNIANHFDESIAFAKSMRLKKYKPFECARIFLNNYKPFHIISDLHYLVSSFASTPDCPDVFSVSQGAQSNLFNFLDFLTLLQGMQVQKRAILNHVEFEFEGWAHTFHISKTLMRTVKVISDSYNVKGNPDIISRLLFFISETMDSLYSWTVQDHFECISKYRLQQSNLQIAETGFHIVGIVPGHSFRVPDYKVGFLPISMHHPLHWLLSSLLIQLPRLLKHISNPSIMSHIHQEIFAVEGNQGPRTLMKEGDVLKLPELLEYLSPNDRQLLIFDYPLQVCALISQVKAGIWVRNGRSVRAQADYFKDLLLSDCYSKNLFLLQFSCLKFGGDVFLNVAVDRFAITEWFLDTETRFETGATQVLVQDFIHLLIVLLTDRAYLAGNSNTQIIRKEMIHQLACCSSGLAFSALTKRMESMANDFEAHSNDEDYQSFEFILNTIANFKYPDGIADHGVYTLKDECFEQVNPWFWHYTRNQREEVEEILRKKYKNRPDFEQVLFTPKFESLQIGSGLEKIGEMIHTQTFVHLCLVGLWKCIRPVIEKPGSRVLDDTIWSGLIYLVLVALHIVKTEGHLHSENTFLHHCESVKVQVSISWDSTPRMTSLLDLLLCIVDRANETDFKEQSHKFRYIVRQFEEIGGETIQTIIYNWRTKSDWNFFNQPKSKSDVSDNTLSEKERKKLASKARQANIMAQFAQAQSSFMANFEDEMEDVDDDHDVEVDVPDTEMYPDEKQASFPEGSCIVCQEETKCGGRLYGMLCLLDRSNLKRQVDFSDSASIKGVDQCPLTLDSAAERPVFDPLTLQSHFPDFQEQVDQFTDQIQNSKNGTRLNKPSIIANACGHLMHMDCFRNYMQSIQARQNSQPLRNHPENLSKNEFLCPLCKSLGNAVLPVIWSSKTEQINWNGTEKSKFDDGDVMVYFTTEVATYLTELINKRAKKTVSEHVIGVMVQPELPGSFPTDEEASNQIKEMVSQNMAIGSISDLYIMSTYAENYEQVVYSRLVKLENDYKDETLIPSEFNMSPLIHLWKLLYSTIINAEIQSRGSTSVRHCVISDQHIPIGILDRISESSLKLVRVLSETGLTALFMSAKKYSDSLQQFSIDFLKSFLPDSSRKTGPRMHLPLLLRDGFKHLVYLVMSTFTQFENHFTNEALMWVRLLGYFEIVRSVISFIEASMLYKKVDIPPSQEFKANPKKFESICKLFWFITESLGFSVQISPEHIPFLLKYSKTNYLLYLRKVAILMYARFGMVPPSGSMGFGDLKRGSYTTQDDQEIDRLCKFLNVPTFEEFLNNISDPFYTTMISHWCENLKNHDIEYWSNIANVDAVPKITIDQPQMYELISLPKRLEVLFEVAFHTQCKKCNTSPADPSICLFCGQICCTQSLCCATDSYGECNLHMREYLMLIRCGSAYGAYFNVKRCSILLLRQDSGGIFLNPPYLDVHGEIDPGLNRGRPQFLNQKRYDEIRKLWLTGAIPSHIARKLEELFDHGGWRTL